MLELPEGWESDYDGHRWFYRYRPNGLTQFQFPQPGDEFPNFVGDSIELEPEERLASELQRRGRSPKGGDPRDEPRRSQSGSREKVGVSPEDNGLGMSATGYFDPSSFMYFGPDAEEDEALIVNEHDDEQNANPRNGNEESPVSAAGSLRSSEPTPSTVRSELATIPLVTVDDSATSENHLVEVPEDTERKRSPVGSVPELAGPNTAKCADELAPIELDAVSSVPSLVGAALLHSNVAELSADNYPAKRKPPPPPPPAPLEPVDSYPLVSASFSFPPLRNGSGSSNSTGTKAEVTKVQENLNVSKERSSSTSEGRAKFQPFVPQQLMSRDTTRDPQRFSMILSSTTVLQSQNSELGHIKPAASDKSAPQSTNGLGRPKIFEPPVDPKRASVPEPLQAPQKMQLDASSNPLPEQSQLPPLPGSGARHHSISSYPSQILEDDRNPDSSYASSISNPAYRRSIVSLPQLQQPYILASGPSKAGNLPATYVSREDYAPFYLVGSLPIVASAAPLRPRKSPRPDHVVSVPSPRSPLPRSSHSMPDTLDRISDAISELSSAMPTPSSSHNAQAQTSQPLGVSPVHTPELNQQQKISELMGSQGASELASDSFTTEGSRVAQYSPASPPVDQRSSIFMGPTTHQVSNEGSRQGQTCPSPLSVSSLPVHGQASSVSLQSSSPRPSPAALVSPRSSGQAGSNSNSSAAKEPPGIYDPQQTPTELPSKALDPLPSPQSQVSSLHRGSSTASARPQIGGSIQPQSTGDIPQPSPVSTQSLVHELPATSARSSQPPAAEAAPAKPKPFPMLPGQVTPMPSQMGSAPILLQPVKDQPTEPNSTQQSSSTVSSAQQSVYGRPSIQNGSLPASLGMPVGTGQGQQQYPQLLPQIKPDQQNVAQGYATTLYIQTRPTLKSNQRPVSFHSGAVATTRPLASTLQSTAPYSTPDLRSNGTAAASETGRGVKKWAKKIFQSSSAKVQNAAVAGVVPVVPLSGPDPTNTAGTGWQFTPGMTTADSSTMRSSADQAHQQSTSQDQFYFPLNQSQIVTTAAAPKSHQNQPLPPTAHISSNNNISAPSPYHSPPQTPKPPKGTEASRGKVGASNTESCPFSANGATSIVTPGSGASAGAGAGPVPGSKHWVPKAIDYSGGDWGDDWS